MDISMRSPRISMLFMPCWHRCGTRQSARSARKTLARKRLRWRIWRKTSAAPIRRRCKHRLPRFKNSAKPTRAMWMPCLPACMTRFIKSQSTKYQALRVCGLPCESLSKKTFHMHTTPMYMQKTVKNKAQSQSNTWEYAFYCYRFLMAPCGERKRNQNAHSRKKRSAGMPDAIVHRVGPCRKHAAGGL